MIRTAASLAADHARRVVRKVRPLVEDPSGVSIIEFALMLPILGTLGFFGLEMGYAASVNTQVSQLALSIADNASRLGQTDNSAVTPTVAESDIEAVMFGAMQQGSGYDFEENGRIILTSFERDPTTGRQYIHWQRCAGDLNRTSSYGNDTNLSGLTGTAKTGIGETGHTVSAPSNTQAVMFVEVYYRYEPLLTGLFVDTGELEFKQEAAMLVRDDRNLSGGGGDGLTGTKTLNC